MSTKEKIESIRSDIAQGLKSRAMNRLQGLINAYPNEMIYREVLGRLYLSVDWKEKAGLHLLLIEPKNKEEQQAKKDYLNSINNSGHKALVDYTFKGSKEYLSDYARKRLKELEAKSLKETSSIPKYIHHPPNKTERTVNTKTSWKDKLIIATILTIFVSILALIVIGIIQVFKWIF